MIGTVLPINTFSAAASAGNTQLGTQTIDNQGFMKILLSQMASPDLSSLFSDENSGAAGSSFFGGSSSSPLSGLLGGNNISALTGGSTLNSGLFSALSSPQMELSIFSNLIGKNIEGFDAVSGNEVKGTVKSVVISDGKTQLEVGDKFILPSTVSKVS